MRKVAETWTTNEVSNCHPHTAGERLWKDKEERKRREGVGDARGESTQSIGGRRGQIFNARLCE